MMKLLERIDRFLCDQTDSRYILLAFLWYFVYIPFRLIYEPVDLIWGNGKRRRKELRDSRDYIENVRALLKHVVAETKRGVYIDLSNLEAFGKDNEIKDFNSILKYLLTWKYVSINVEGYYVTNPERGLENYERTFPPKN